jgi:hydroxysqualene synthase
VSISAGEARSGKGHRDENFPVASRLIHPRHRAPILAFYEFVRTADDIADHPTLPPGEKLALLDRLEASLTGGNEDEPVGVALRTQLRTRGLPTRHAQDLLTAFRMDVTKLRYRDWDELIHYCTYSAMPVGRFVLDVHGENGCIWPANDALCAALQIINHLQDCGRDYRNLDRVYLPLDALGRHGAAVESLSQNRASPELLRAMHDLAVRTAELLRDSSLFSSMIADARLALEVAVIQSLAERLCEVLKRRDPLCDRVHLSKAAVAGFGAVGVLRGIARRAAGMFRAPKNAGRASIGAE